jgi:hypothetical protein
VRIGQPLLGEDDERRTCVGILNDIGAVRAGDNEIANGRVGAVEKAWAPA